MKYILALLLTILPASAQTFAVVQQTKVVAIWDSATEPENPPKLSGGKTLVPAPSYVKQGWSYTAQGFLNQSGQPQDMEEITPETDVELIDKVIARLTTIREQLAAEPNNRRLWMEAMKAGRELSRFHKVGLKR